MEIVRICLKFLFSINSFLQIIFYRRIHNCYISVILGFLIQEGKLLEYPYKYYGSRVEKVVREKDLYRLFGVCRDVRV